MKYSKKTLVILICITAILSVLITLAVLHGLQWLPTGSQFSFDTLGVFLGAIGSVGAIFAIWLTTRKQLNEQKEMQKQNVQISIEQNELQKQIAEISKEQKDIQKQSIKLMLYEKRSEVYSRIKSFISFVMLTPSLSYQEITEFYHECREAVLLFDNDICEYIDLMWKQAKKLAHLAEKEKAGVLEKSDVNERLELLKWFSDQYKDLICLFDAYINVKKIGL